MKTNKNTIIMHTPEPGSGAGRYVYELTRSLASIGWDATLLAPGNFDHRAALAAETTVELSSLGLRANDSGRGLALRTLDNLRFLARALRAQLRIQSRSQLIHFQFPVHLPFGLAPFLLAKASGKKIVFTAHDPVPHKWLFPEPWNRLERFALKCIYQLSDRIIVHSEAGRNTVANEFAVPAHKLSVIAHGPFSVSDSVASDLRKNAGYFEVLVFGALRENKGIHLAIEAVSNLVHKGVPVRLTIAGQTPNGKEEAYWATCERLIKESPAAINLQKRYIPDSEVPGLLAQSDCVLLPYTLFSSDSGIASLALSNAKPIVATTSGGLGELLGKAELGVTIESPTVAAVEAALLSAWQKGPEELARLGRNGAEHILQNCSWRAAAAKTGALYGELLGSTPQVVAGTTQSARIAA